MLLSDLGVAIRGFSVGYGRLGIDGRLGYDYSYTDGLVYCNHAQKCDGTISAHAPSSIDIDISKPLSICGATHVSFFAKEPARFWVDEHWIGDLFEPGARTPWINLAPGHYTLNIEIQNKDWAHTLWLFNQCDRSDADRLAVVTVGCYDREVLPIRLRWLFQSAASAGIHVRVHGVGEALGNWFTRKIETLAKFIGNLPPSYEWVLYMDGNDTTVIADEAEIVSALRGYGGVCVGAEACAWPCTEPGFVERFQSPTIHKFPQAGIWGGERIALLRALWELQDLHYRIKIGKGPDFCYKDGVPIANAWDDQFLWQVLHLEYPHRFFVPDYYWSVTANLTCTSVNPRNSVFSVESGRIVTCWGTRPVAVHVSGWRKELAALWAGILRRWK